MQESFQEKRRANALRSNPTWVLRTLAILLAIGVSAAVLLSLRKRPPAAVPAVPAQATPIDGSGSPGYAPPDPKADELQALVFESFTASGKKGVELLAASSSGRESERRFLDTVKARIPFVSQGRAASLEIVADHAQHVASRPSALFQGHVKMTTDDGLVLETDELFYDGYDGRAQSEGKVTWHRKDVSGEARGMLYEGWSDSITFFKDVKIRLRDPDDAPADISADSACLSRTENILYLERNVLVDLNPNRVKSGSLALFFGDDRSIYRAIFRDGVELVINGDTAALGFSFPRADGRKTIKGRRLEVEFGENRRPREVAAGPEAVMIIEPGPLEPKERREISGDRLVFKFGEDGKLREYLGISGTSVRFVPLDPSGGSPRSISATDFQATIDPVTGEAETIKFFEKVVFERKNQRGQGDQATFSEKTARMVVTGKTTFEDTLERVSLSSRAMDIDTRTGSFEASGGVRHTQKGGIPNAPFGAPGSDLLATSARVRYDAVRKATQYLDRVIFRAGADELRALNIESVETPAGPSITADTDVEVLAGGGAKAEGLNARSAKMTYTPKGRRFAFTGGASVQQKDFDTKAPEILVSLGPLGSFVVESLEASGGAVTLTSMDRTAQGTHLLFTPGNGRVQMEGSPVRLESQGRRIAGKSVTFFTEGDQVEVVGEEGRTETVLQRKIKQP